MIYYITLKKDEFDYIVIDEVHKRLVQIAIKSSKIILCLNFLLNDSFTLKEMMIFDIFKMFH